MSVRSSPHRRRPWRRGASLIGIGLTLLLGLALGPIAAPGVAGTATDADTLREQVAYDGWVRVRVDLRTDGTAAPTGPLAAARTAAAPAAGADTRAQTIDDLLFALPDPAYRGLAYSAEAASLTLSVDAAAGLDGLLASPLVATVGAEKMRRIAAGEGHSLAINPDGRLWAWGWNASGQLGDGTTTDRSTPVQVLTGVAAVAGRYRYSLALKTDGSLWAWGYNRWGQLGDGTTADRSTPVQVLTGVAAIAAGCCHSLALKTDGSLWAWGWNHSGRLGDGTTTDRSTPVQVLTGVAAVAGGGGYTLPLKTDGSLWAWGYNANGQLGDGTTTNRSTPVQVQFPVDFAITRIALPPPTPSPTASSRPR